MSKHKRIRIKCFLQKDESLESVTSLFKSANWSEREMYDMLGVKVVNHPNLKRLIMPDDWYDHPLKKTYPLQGDEAASWYEVDKIFGKEARSIIGPEQRDPAAIDRYDTTRFARLGHEVPFDTDISEFEPEAVLLPLVLQERIRLDVKIINTAASFIGTFHVLLILEQYRSEALRLWNN